MSPIKVNNMWLCKWIQVYIMIYGAYTINVFSCINKCVKKYADPYTMCTQLCSMKIEWSECNAW